MRMGIRSESVVAASFISKTKFHDFIIRFKKVDCFINRCKACCRIVFFYNLINIFNTRMFFAFSKNFENSYSLICKPVTIFFNKAYHFFKSFFGCFQFLILNVLCFQTYI
eukprot:gnl/Chilomastix_cuspidata/7027.p3 GENE.gnl/Chilomastix_cuspidata/7027~~gnl/Chilomastix_cuspidata/7027.p3  ORF type:complete len:110 (+),score=6.43 gnl/Chilomastix_cuspidata/7027:290-619(+)